MAEWPCCHDPLRFSPTSLRFVPPPSLAPSSLVRNPSEVSPLRRTHPHGLPPPKARSGLVFFHEANSRQNLSGWHKGEIWLPFSPVANSHQHRQYQPKIPRRPENANFGLFWPKNGSPCAFGKLAIKRDPDLAIDFRLLRRLTNAHIYNSGPKSPAAPKTQNLAKICVL